MNKTMLLHSLRFLFTQYYKCAIDNKINFVGLRTGILLLFHNDFFYRAKLYTSIMSVIVKTIFGTYL
jgi:hypothetical protein